MAMAEHSMIEDSSTRLEARVLLPDRQEQILVFARSLLAQTVEDPMDREMQSWNARWRQEALEHYLPLGWSFGAFETETETDTETGIDIDTEAEQSLRGVVLAQPLLFFRGLTQTLWVEHFSFTTPRAGVLLLETLYAWARDKHLQCVLMEDEPGVKALLASWKQARLVDSGLIEWRTSRY
ncbi:MAG: hypothetical protein AB7G93_12145 [Bdellovibrionales bacterium]